MMDATLPMANVTTVLIVIHCFVRHLVMDIAMDSVVDVLNMVLMSRIMHWITICIIMSEWFQWSIGRRLWLSLWRSLLLWLFWLGWLLLGWLLLRGLLGCRLLLLLRKGLEVRNLVIIKMILMVMRSEVCSWRWLNEVRLLHTQINRDHRMLDQVLLCLSLMDR